MMEHMLGYVSDVYGASFTLSASKGRYKISGSVESSLGHGCPRWVLVDSYFNISSGMIKLFSEKYVSDFNL